MYAVWLGPGSKSVQEKRKGECARQLQQIYMAMTAYAADHNGAFPNIVGATNPSQPLCLLVPQYTSDTTLFICPGSRDSALPCGASFSGRRISYAYYAGYRLPNNALPPEAESWPLLSDVQVNAEPKRKGKPVFAGSDKAPGNNHRGFGGNVLFLDGHFEKAEPRAGRDLPVFRGVSLLNP